MPGSRVPARQRSGPPRRKLCIADRSDPQIKPENILLSKDRTVVKLCDFGVSEMFDAKGSDRIKHAGGSPAFLSPESFTSGSALAVQS